MANTEIVLAVEVTRKLGVVVALIGDMRRGVQWQRIGQVVHNARDGDEVRKGD